MRYHKVNYCVTGSKIQNAEVEFNPDWAVIAKAGVMNYIWKME